MSIGMEITSTPIREGRRGEHEGLHVTACDLNLRLGTHLINLTESLWRSMEESSYQNRSKALSYQQVHSLILRRSAFPAAPRIGVVSRGNLSNFPSYLY